MCLGQKNIFELVDCPLGSLTERAERAGNEAKRDFDPSTIDFDIAKHSFITIEQRSEAIETVCKLIRCL
jgi:hypothetical protein